MISKGDPYKFNISHQNKISQLWREKTNLIPKVQQLSHCTQVTTKSMYNLPKSIEGELQRFIQNFVHGVSWLRLKEKEKNIDVKVRD